MWVPRPSPHCRLGWGGSVLIANLLSFPEETACFCCSRTLSSELLGLEKLEVADRTGLCLAGGWGAPHPLICRWALRTLGGVRQPARLRLRSCSQACSHLRGALRPELGARALPTQPCQLHFLAKQTAGSSFFCFPLIVLSV